MSGCFWQINGINLTSATVTVQPTKLTNDQGVRQALSDIHNGGQHRERVGKDLAKLAIEISFLGVDVDKFELASTVTDILDDDDVWTLRAPASKHVCVYKDSKRAALSTDGWKMDVQRALGRITISVTAIVDGIWITDGGDYCETITGNFTLQSNGTYTRNDNVNTGTKPILRVPQQVNNVLIAVLAYSYQFGGPALIGTAVVDGLTYADYDMTGFLIPPPAASGDVGIYEACSSPTDTFLDGAVPDEEASQAPVLNGAALVAPSGNVLTETYDFGTSLAVDDDLPLDDETPLDNTQSITTDNAAPKSETTNITNT